ncbi:xin actin-binding repeat-containing protein 1 isoform X2 [Oryzias latipes]|nr:xin actin-binding repeat-containing protein 1 isoform X2 [Oryzias latipes]
MSKVATQDSARKLSKLEQQQTFSSEKRAKLTKMEEDSQKSQDDYHQAEAEDLTEASSEHLQHSQLSREMLYKQRQKCELRRLLKHTHPELKMLDNIVDEEFAEVLSSEKVAAGETGYEGEVLSRRLIFENRALSDKAFPSTPKIQMAQGGVERCDFNKAMAVLKEPKELQIERVEEALEDDKSSNANLSRKTDSEEELKRKDVQASRRIFENQSKSISRSNQDRPQGKVSMFRDEGSILEKQNKQSERKEREHSSDKSSSKNIEVQLQVSSNDAVSQRTGLSSSEVVCSGATLSEQESISDPGNHGKMIKTSAVLFSNNPFISGNIEKEKSFEREPESLNHESVAADDRLIVNVKNRTNLFESMPFDKIRHQNKEDAETLVENIKETLSFLYHIKAIHSSGAIIEVNETMKAKRAKFLLLDSGPQINYNDVTEGGAQNLILQLLPRTNLKPQITYLKEDSEGCMQTMAVDVPHHQHQFCANKDTEFKTANVVQLVEDILNQDNSLRKGLIIQENVSNFTEVILYSLYKYFDEQDVKSYSPPQAVGSDKESMETIDAPQETFRDAELDRYGVKGNVKLFKDCIEKGDFEYLKTLQAESAGQQEECSENQKLAGDDRDQTGPGGEQAVESNTEWVPVDIKRLKSIFSKDKTNIQDTNFQSSYVSNLSFAKIQSCTESNTEDDGNLAQEEPCHSVVPQFIEQVDDNVHPAKEVETTYQVSTLQAAMYDLQQATHEAKLLYQSLQETQKIPFISNKADVEPLGREANLPRDVGQKVESCTEAGSPECLPASNIITGQDEMTETGHEDKKLENVQICEARNEKDHDNDVILKQDFQAGMALASSSRVSPALDEEQEGGLQGKMQAALESLERSNINVTRGDFRAAMIYRSSYKPSQGKPQKLSNQKPENEKVSNVTDSKLAQPPLSQEGLVDNSPHGTEYKIKGQTNAASRKSERSTGPKPTIPPKPEHFKVKQDQSIALKKPEETQTKNVRSKEPMFQSPQPPEMLVLDQNKQCKPNERSTEHQSHEDNNKSVEMLLQTKGDHVQSSAITLESNQTDNSSTTGQPEVSAAVERHGSKNATGRDNRNKTDKNQADLKESIQDLGEKKDLSMRTAPPKPIRLKILQNEDKTRKHKVSNADDNSKPVQSYVDPPSDTCRLTEIRKDKQEKEMKQEDNIETREKTEEIQMEEDCHERLSIHMDKIVRENITAAMEICDNLQKQEQLQSILSRVEEIEKDTSEVDVKILRRAFENVPDWAVRSDKRTEKNRDTENKGKKSPIPQEKTDSTSPMAHVYGDLERASAEIIHLKEQTIARLLDIEDAIRKALYSVSTLKSDSDIASLSYLLKESFGQKASPAGNITQITIHPGSMEPQGAQESCITREIPAATETASASQQPSLPSTPSHIAIQSEATKSEPQKTRMCPTCQQNAKEEKFQTTKTLMCNSPTQGKRMNSIQSGQKPEMLISDREVSVLEVQTDSDGNGITGRPKENQEKMDGSGNRCYSSKIVMATEPETIKATSKAVFSPSKQEVSTYPEFQLPVSQITTFKPK